MKNRDLKVPIPEAQEYMCQTCEARFFYLEKTKLVCPKCGNHEEDSLLPIDEIEEEEVIEK